MDVNRQDGIPLTAKFVAALILAAIVVGAVSLWRIDTSGDAGSGLPARFEYDLDAYKKIDPALVIAHQTGQILLTIKESRAVAVGPEDRVYVGGDRAIVVFNADGQKRAEIKFDGEPRCLAVAAAQSDSPGRIYVGMREHLEVVEADGRRKTVWPSFGEKAVLTSIALADPAGESDVFVADAGNRVVLRLDSAGKVIGRIGKRDPDRHVPGLIIPSPYFDVAVAADGLLRVANTGAHRIEAYTFDGDYEQPLVWGKASLQVEGFCGCCNPANFTLLPDGRFVTAEKGIPRVKLYSDQGKFEGVITGPETLAPRLSITEETREDHRLPVVDVAADSRSRILVLDTAAQQVRIFEIRGKTMQRQK